MKLFQLVEHMAVLRKEPGIWNQQFSGFNPTPATNVASSPSSPRFRGPDPACRRSRIIYSLRLGFSGCRSGADEAIPLHVCRSGAIQAAFWTQSDVQFLQTTQPLKTEHLLRAKKKNTTPQNLQKSSAAERAGLSV